MVFKNAGTLVLSGLLTIALATGCGSEEGSAGNPTCASWSAEQAQFETEVVNAMNAERAAGTDCASGAKEPAPAVAMDPALQEAARCHSQDMVLNNFFSHTGSNSSRFNERINDAGFEGSAQAENIAVGQGSPEGAVSSWMASTAGHCDAIMNPNTTHVGIGYVPGTANTDWPTYWTATFGRK